MNALLHPLHVSLVATLMGTMTCGCLGEVTVPTPPKAAAVPSQPERNAAGTILEFGIGELTLAENLGGTNAYLVNSHTQFMDLRGSPIARGSITTQTPVTLYFAPVGGAQLAIKVVVSTAFFIDGTLLEVSPGGLVIEPGAEAEPVRYVSNASTQYVNHHGALVPGIPTGMPVRVFYARVADALVASKVEALADLTKAPIQAESATPAARAGD